MSADALLAWKAKIATYQQQVKASLSAKQDTLFELASFGISPAHVDPDTIDPFSLLLQPLSFWRWPVDSPGNSCIYIVSDIAVPLTTESCSTDTNTSTGKLILYIGETCRSNHRWKDNHGCTRVLVQISGFALSIWHENRGWYWLLVEHSSAEKASAAPRTSADQKMEVSF
jgi:hypothetical protein